MFEPLTIVLLLAIPFVVCALASCLVDESSDPCVSRLKDSASTSQSD